MLLKLFFDNLLDKGDIGLAKHFLQFLIPIFAFIQAIIEYLQSFGQFALGDENHLQKKFIAEGVDIALSVLADEDNDGQEDGTN